MVDPIVFPILSLCFLGYMAINTSGMTLSYFIPWCTKKYKDSRLGEKIYRSNSNYFVAFFLAIESYTESQCLGHRQSEEINHSGGTAYVDIPQMGHYFHYKDFLKIEQIYDEKGLGVHVVWEEEDMEKAISFLDLIKMRIDPHYKNSPKRKTE